MHNPTAIFVTYKTVTGEDRAKHFFSYEGFWNWLQDVQNETGQRPPGLCVYEAECVFDGS